MKTKSKSQKGFTLIEFMIAIMAGAILLLAAGIVVSVGQTSWNKAWKKVNLQREASVAMIRMVRSIKAGISAQVEDDGKTVVIYSDEDSIKFSHVVDASTNVLIYQIGAEQPQIISSKVENLQFGVQANKVTIDLKLKDDDAQAHFVSTVMMRNYGG
jgi:prepilin-type N-terminal cleavage/methylation domain-containing protein